MQDYCRLLSAQRSREEVKSQEHSDLQCLIFNSEKVRFAAPSSAEIVYLVDGFADRSHKLVLHILEINLRFQSGFAM